MNKLSVSEVRNSNLRDVRGPHGNKNTARSEVNVQDTSNICEKHQRLGNEARCNDELCMFHKIRLCFKHHKFGLNAYYCEGNCDWNEYVKST